MLVRQLQPNTSLAVTSFISNFGENLENLSEWDSSCFPGSQIQEQVEKINAALQERQEVINDQIAELNVIRQKKITLDK